MEIVKYDKSYGFYYITERTYEYLLQDILIWIKDNSWFSHYTNLSNLLDDEYYSPYAEAVYEYLVIAVAEENGVIDEDLFLPDGLREFYFQVVEDDFEHLYFHFSKDVEKLLNMHRIMYINVYDSDCVTAERFKNSALQDVW